MRPHLKRASLKRKRRQERNQYRDGRRLWDQVVARIHGPRMTWDPAPGPDFTAFTRMFADDPLRDLPAPRWVDFRATWTAPLPAAAFILPGSL